MKEVPLGSVAEILMGTAPPGETYNAEGRGLPMIAGAGDYGDRHPEPKQWTTAPSRVAEVGDLIICVRATIGDLNWADRRYCLGRGVGALRPHPGKLDISYLAHYMTVAKAKLERFGTGSTFPAIRRGHLEDFPIPLPPLAEQKRIAAVLDKADDLRAKRREALARANFLITSVFHDSFGEPVKLPLTWKEHATSSPGWTECTMGDQVMLQRGKDITKSIARAGNVPVISSGGVSFFHDEALARGPGVLLGRKGSVGNVHYVESDYWPHDTTLYVRDFKGNEPLFVYHFFLRFPISQYEASAANPSLNRNNIHPVKVHWPSRELQRRFVGIVEGVERQKVRMTRHLAELDALFASLQSAAFAGTPLDGQAAKPARRAVAV